MADGETFIQVRLFVYAVSTSDVLVRPSHFSYASLISEHPQAPPNSRTHAKLTRFHHAHYLLNDNFGISKPHKTISFPAPSSCSVRLICSLCFEPKPRDQEKRTTQKTCCMLRWMIFAANELDKKSRTSGVNYSDLQTSVLPFSHCSWISASDIWLPTATCSHKARRVLEIATRI